MAISKELESKLENEKFLEKLDGARDVNGLKEILSSEGLDFKKDVIGGQANEELDEKSLENVSGGIEASYIIKTLGPVAYKGWKCMLTNMNWQTGEFSKCTCGLHKRWVR